MTSRVKYFAFPLVILGLAVSAQQLASQSDQTSQTDSKQQTTDSNPQAPAKPTVKEQKKRERALEKELASPYKKWIEEDVVYIITAEERSAFLHLETNEEREQFIENF